MKKIIQLTGACLCVICFFAACSGNKVKAPEKILTAEDSAKAYNDSLIAESKYIPSEDKLLNPDFDPEKLYGIGIFKIGMPISIIDSLKKTASYSEINDVQRLTSADKEALATGKPILFKNLPNVNVSDDEKEEPTTQRCPQIDFFTFDNYTISNIRIKYMYLVFYKGKLVALQASWSKELLDAIRAKYGEANMLHLTQNIVEYWEAWKNGDVITKNSTQDFIKMDIRGAQNLITKCGQEHVRALLHEQQSKEKEKLKDF